MTKKYLDYLVIPNSSGKIRKQRKSRAIEEIYKRNIGSIIILKGKNSEEDILYLGRIAKKGDRVGFDTFPIHFREYMEIIKKAMKERKFPKGVRTELIATSQTLKEFVYGELGLEEERIFEGKVDYMKNKKGRFFQKLKQGIKRLINLEN